MRFHCGISFSWRTIKKYLIPILIGLLTAFGFGFLGVNAEEVEQTITLEPTSVYYKKNNSTLYPTPTSTDYVYVFNPDNSNSNAYDFTLEYNLNNICNNSTNTGKFKTTIGMYLSSGLTTNINLQAIYVDGGSLGGRIVSNDGWFTYETSSIDLSKPIRLIYNETSRNEVLAFYYNKSIQITCDSEPVNPDNPDVPSHSDFSNYIYYFDDRTTTDGLLSNIYILLFLYCIGMLTLKFINIVRNTRWK